MRKIINVFLSLCICFCTLFTASGCIDQSKKHTHDYKTTWSKDGTHHWRECLDANCDEKSQYEEHNFESGFCSTCGYEQSHEHSFSTTWSKDGTHHWYDCLDANCDEKSQYGEQSNNARKARNTRVERPIYGIFKNKGNSGKI